MNPNPTAKLSHRLLRFVSPETVYFGQFVDEIMTISRQATQ